MIKYLPLNRQPFPSNSKSSIKDLFKFNKAKCYSSSNLPSIENNEIRTYEQYFDFQNSWIKNLKVIDKVEAVDYPKNFKRCGLIAIKKGMTTLFSNSGIMYPCTILKVEDCQVVRHKTIDKDGVDALVLGTKNKPPRLVTSGLLQEYKKAKVHPKYKLMEFRVPKESFLPVGTILYPSHFLPGQYVDCQATTKGKGFQGVMKRWGMKGQPASHGVSKTHRHMGSEPGKVWKGKKMPGNMGNILKIDNKLGLIYVKDTVPGCLDAYVRIRDTVVGGDKFKYPEELFPPPFPSICPSKVQKLPEIMLSKMMLE